MQADGFASRRQADYSGRLVTSQAFCDMQMHAEKKRAPRRSAELSPQETPLALRAFPQQNHPQTRLPPASRGSDKCFKKYRFAGARRQVRWTATEVRSS
jgi:hypothetical protein